ncbi:hypothetical protein GOV10_01300 [Candidatus Woesearchaeota archaeon]|nr:hypothetical protein [Candidatus Woesearchaeota archaeon]
MKTILFIILVASLLVLSACGNVEKTTEPTTPAETTQEETILDVGTIEEDASGTDVDAALDDIDIENW